MKLKPNDNKVSLKRYFLLKALYYNVNKIINTPLDECFHFGCNNEELPFNNNHLDIVTIAFNNEHVIRLQINYIRKNITDKDYTFIVADNSNKEDKQIAIRKICEEEGIGYISLPKFSKEKLSRMGSYSHGTAISWVYFNYIQKRKPAYFGFLDHDVFPAKKISIEEKINDFNGFYGYMRGKIEGAWYLWPGMIFFDYKIFSQYNANFLPSSYNGSYLDTGGSLWKNIFSKLDKDKIKFASFKRFPLSDLGYDNPSPVEFIDGNDWFHSSNASHWREVESYDHLIEEIIENNK